MSIKERLFGPPWESKDAQTRARSVATTDDPRLLEQLPSIAARDAEPDVRLAALKRLENETAWLQARSVETSAEITTAADQFLLRAVCRQSAGIHLERRLAWLERVESGQALRRVAASAADPELREAALERIQSPGFLGDCVVSETDDAIASRLLSRIEQVSTLKRIASELRKKRKHRHQEVIQRLAALEEDTDRHDARNELAARLISQAEKLARGEFTGDRKAEAERLTERWQQLTNPEPHLTRRFDGAMRIVESALRPRQSPTDHESPTPKNLHKPDVTAADAELEKLEQQARKMAGQPLGDKTSEALNRLISTFDRRWNDLRSPGPADRAVREHFQALVGELQARLELHDRPKPKKDKSSQQQKPDADLAGELDRALEKADRALAAGDIAESHQAIRAARSLHDRLPKRTRPREIEGRLTRMAGKLKEMRDWQHWSNNELRERLIERVGEIDAENLHPDAVTERLKELRQRWKELDEQEVLPGDKRRFAAPQGQWRRFQSACKKAFESARPYLEKRSEVREESHRELQAFLDSARQVAEDPQTPKDKLIRYQRAAREAIRNLDSLPPKVRGKSAAALRELMDNISAALDRHFEAIEAEKRRLVAEARKLAHEKDRGVAIDRAKALQTEWKKAGRGRRKSDDQLWNEFREPIDPLFEHLKHERDERRHLEHQHAEALKDLCERAEALAEASDPQSVAGQIAGLEDEFNQHASVPPALSKRFTRALDRFRRQLDAARTARTRQKEADLVDLGEQLQSAWRERLAGRQPEAPEALPDVSEQDEIGRRLHQRLARVLAGDDLADLGAEVDALTAQARQVVIEMECLSGLESPAEDTKLRMDYQIRRLSSRLGEGAPKADLDSEHAELQQRWFESLPHDPEQHDSLQKRFYKANKILKEMASN